MTPELDANALNEAGWKLLECGFHQFNKAKDAARETIQCYLNALAKSTPTPPTTGWHSATAEKCVKICDKYNEQATFMAANEIRELIATAERTASK